MSTDLFVDAHDGVRLAVRDHGGDGRPLILMHGAGSHLLSLEYLAAQLGSYRVVTMDLRWSGQSGDSDRYDWADLVRDVESVAAALDLGSPAVAGHSWGGIIAAHYGAAHPEAPAVVNLDGHGRGDPSLYDGLTGEEIDRAMAMLAVSDPTAAHDPEGDDEWRAKVLAEMTATNEMLGLRPDLARAFAERNLLQLAEGRWRRHPSKPMYDGLRDDLRLFDLYPTIACPLLVVNAPVPPPGVPPELERLLAAYRRGLTRAFAELVAGSDNVRVVTLDDADHVGIATKHAPRVATEVASFLASVGY